jgi:hypothetical protein
MAQAPIRRPEVSNAGGLPWVQIQPLVTESSSGAFKYQQFIVKSGTGSSAVAAKVADAAVTVWGLSQRDAAGTAAEAYLTPTANQHGAINPNAVFTVNVMTSTKAVGTGATSSVVEGNTYGLGSFTTTGYTDVQGLNISSTTATESFFRVLKIRTDLDAVSDTNGRVDVVLCGTKQS